MLSKTIIVDGVKATVHTETGRDVIMKRHLYARINTEGIEWDLWFPFIRALVQSSDVVVPFAWPQLSDDLETLKAARESFYDLSGDVFRAWEDALIAVDTPPGDIDLAPVIDEKKSETPSSPKNETALEAS